MGYVIVYVYSSINRFIYTSFRKSVILSSVCTLVTLLFCLSIRLSVDSSFFFPIFLCSSYYSSYSPVCRSAYLLLLNCLHTSIYVWLFIFPSSLTDIQSSIYPFAQSPIILQFVSFILSLSLFYLSTHLIIFNYVHKYSVPDNYIFYISIDLYSLQILYWICFV